MFILGVACTTPLLRTAGSVAAPREVFQGRTLLSVEPSNKVRRGRERAEWGWGAHAWPCGRGARSPEGSLGPSPFTLGLCGAPSSLPRPQPFTRKEIIGFVIGSVSSALYLFSRLPQIRTNVSRGQGGRAVGRAGWQLGPWVKDEHGGAGSSWSRSGPPSPLAWVTESGSPSLSVCLWKRTRDAGLLSRVQDPCVPRGGRGSGGSERLRQKRRRGARATGAC